MTFDSCQIGTLTTKVIFRDVSCGGGLQ